MAPTDQKIQERIVFDDNRLASELFGEQNANLHKIEEALNVHITGRGNELVIAGPNGGPGKARQVLEALWDKLKKGQDVDSQVVDAAIRFQEKQHADTPKRRKGDASEGGIEGFTDAKAQIITRKKKIQPRTPLQATYIEKMYKNQLVFGIGPAGTGKTYLAVAMAVAMLEQGIVERIILSRPALEAGERIGFLPGEMKEKMDPYMRPLYDALHDTMPADAVQRKMASEEIEIAPLAFMRGRTLNNAFIILDEAQNTSAMQMLMFLTRVGENSHMVITGDPAQTDLSSGTRSGLLDAVDTLAGTEGIEFVRFGTKDVVRSALVSKIIHAYDAKKQDK
jgi:phosphate starvation-inducible PhoH-like protein